MPFLSLPMTSRQRPQAIAGAQLPAHDDQAAELHLVPVETELARFADDIIIVDTDVARGQIPERDVGIARVENVGPGRHR